MKIVAVLCVILAVEGCGGRHATTTRTDPASPPTLTLTVFEVRGGILRPSVVAVPRTRALATSVLAALGTHARVTTSGGTAAVALRAATDAQAASIVYSLTQLPGIERVDVAGRRGLTRDDFARYLPPILVETPAPGATVPRTFRVAGTASVFEATVVVELLRKGKVLSRHSATAAEGAPGRGPFALTMRASAGPLLVRVFAPSAADGSPQHEVDVAVEVRS